MLKLLHFTANLSVLCHMLIGVVFSLSRTSCIACVSAVRILYELYTVKFQSASSPVTVDFEEKQKLNVQYWLFLDY